jgi:hypothetical protein
MRRLSADITPTGEKCDGHRRAATCRSIPGLHSLVHFSWQPNKDERPAPPSRRFRHAPITRSLQMHDAVADRADDGVGAVLNAEL